VLYGLFLVLGLGSAGCVEWKDEGKGPKLVPGIGSANFEAPHVLATAILIVNDGAGRAEDVQIDSVILSGATLTAPASLPVGLGSIAPDGSSTLIANFTDPLAGPDASYEVIVAGTYKEHGGRSKFVVKESVRTSPDSPGSSVASTGVTAVQIVNGAHFPPQKPCCPDEMNEGQRARTVPDGPFRPLTPSQESAVQPAPHGSGGSASISFPVNSPVGISSSTVAEPSGASGGGVVFETENWFASYSIDGGSTFTKLDPTTIFPQSDGGFCCDQVVQYAPSIDRFIWVLQYGQSKLPTDTTTNNGPNRYRVAYASPATVKSSGGTSWTYFDLTSTTLIGTNNNTWLDYPDTAVGSNSFYLSADDVNNGGHVVVRVSLSDIQSSSTINFSYTKPSDSAVAYGGHLCQNTGNEVFWAGHNSNSSIRIFNWPESSNTYNWNGISVGSWPQTNSSNLMTSTTPDSQDWLNKLSGFPGNAVLGIARGSVGRDSKQGNYLYFAWTGAIGSGFKQPQVQWIALDRNNSFALVSQQQVWNSAYAFAYPAFGVNSQNEIGMSLEWGGGGNYENHVAGFWGDYVVYATTNSSIGTKRFGDYVTIRQNSADTSKFDAFGYGLDATTPPGGTTVYVHNNIFSR